MGDSIKQPRTHYSPKQNVAHHYSFAVVIPQIPPTSQLLSILSFLGDSNKHETEYTASM